MNGKDVAHLLVTLTVWIFVVVAFLLLFAVTVSAAPGYFVNLWVLAFVLGPASFLVLPTFFLWYHDKHERHPYFWRYFGMGLIMIFSWVGAVTQYPTNPLYIPFLNEAAGFLGVFGVWFIFEKGWVLGEYRGVPTDPAGLHRGTHVLDARNSPPQVWG